MKNKNSLQKSLIILFSTFILFLSAPQVTRGEEEGGVKLSHSEAAKIAEIHLTYQRSKLKAVRDALRSLRRDLEDIMGLLTKYSSSCDDSLLKEINFRLHEYSGFRSVGNKLTDMGNGLKYNPGHPEYNKPGNNDWKNDDYKSVLRDRVSLENLKSDLQDDLIRAKADCAKKEMAGLVDKVKDSPKGNIVYVESNYCRDKAGVPNDPYILTKGSWRQKYDDQWAIKHIGFSTDKKSAWNVEDGSSNPVVVAVIDTGLDWNHKDINWENIWKNTGEIPDNGKDDDGNGYVDDVIGWNFIDDNNKPWDHDGHGTFVTGIIAAATDNKVGIAGINRGAEIMVLKGLNAFGHGRASSLAEAIFYAANNGAKVINISAGGKHLTQTEQDAVNYAHKKGAVIVVAAGNEAMDTKDYSPSGLKNVIAVGATDRDDKRASFSNWGQSVDISAPGIDVLSLRARRADFMLGIPDVDYKPRSAYVGKDRRYFRASGTSFAAPMVAGTASLILAKNPNLTNEQVERMLLNSTRDIEVPGWDQLTGYGLLDASAALKADPDFYTLAKIKKMVPARKDKRVVIQVIGTADSSDFKVARVELGYGEKPEEWKNVGGKIKAVVKEDILVEIPASEFNKKGKWSVKLIVETKKHGERFGLGSLDIQ